MRNKSHKTLIATLLDAVNDWRRSQGWSRETVVQQIVDAHQRGGADAMTGLTFTPPATDAFERAKVNADRVFRWLDDRTKDNNLMPANFLPSVLLALPVNLRVSVLSGLLQPLGLGVRVLATVDAGQLDALGLLQVLLLENGQAQQALAGLIDGITPGELQQAQRELVESIAASQAALVAVEAALGRGHHV